MGASGGTLYTAWVDIGLKGFDKVQSYMNSAVNAVRSGVSSIESELRGSMLLDFGKAGSPLAFNTFSQSLDLVKARIGSSFAPAIAEGAMKLQQFAKYIRDLDPATKQSIADWIKWGAVGSGVVIVLSTIGQKLVALGSLVYNNPWLTAMMGLATGATYAYTKLVLLEDKMKSIVETSQRINKGNISQDDINKSYIGKDLNSIEDAGKRHERANQYLNILEERKKGMMGEVGSYGHMQHGFDAVGITKAVTGKSLQENHTQEFEQLTRDIAIARQFIETAKTGAKPEIKPGASKDNGFMMGAMGTAGRAGSMSLDSSYSSLNSLALGQNQLQQQMLQAQLEGNLAFIDAAKKIGSIDDTLQRATGK